MAASVDDIEDIGDTGNSSDISTFKISPFIKNPKMTTIILREILRADESAYNTNELFSKILNRLTRKYKYQPTKCELGMIYRKLNRMDSENFPYINTLWQALIHKSVRSGSGILNISVSLPPYKFSCKYNCKFCPNEPGMPRSYLSNEDVFRRAAKVDFDTVKQVHNRLDVLETNGHPIDKLEFRVLGGTFSCYDHDITDNFVRDLYYAANTYRHAHARERLSMEEEQAFNVSASVHVVGLGIETRPDEITTAEIIRFRRYGVTRVEIGVQHTNDELLRKVNRGHGVKASKRAVKLLKDYGFKVEIHIMTDLPGATPEGDMECYKEVLTGEDLIPDYLKDYPCLDVDFTEIKKWKNEGKWTPYSERTPDAADLKRVLIYRQSITPPWVRVNRIQRDFKVATDVELGFTSNSIKTNLAQIVKEAAESEGIYCQCIRCCEVADHTYDIDEIKYETRKFTASGATEYFISTEVKRPHRNLLLGFLRPRLGSALEDSVIPELKGNTAIIRELHVYGRVKEVGNDDTHPATQHLGIGKKLLEIAENICRDNEKSKIAIISGIGVRQYYQKRGYILEGTYMTKTLVP
ncbi:MAG: tRNA uridine(34) 5-carboxymethylaminomethyl modification radical SAM/GNAT enzyme Elp3 [Proteobacteria bacterium]|nr:tRNA uridine(34) 5-carboxymethylaminomethyl modification radical SAM/GNAT enzyme Elp3 [Pseudomonadota bacterium]